LAVGLVLATTAAVALVAHATLPGLGWAAAIALGAIVSPPDAVAATAIGRRLHIPHRVITILEGESLVNDATALVLYRAAVAAAVSGTFVLSETLIQFVITAVIGITVGFAIGMLTRWVLQLTHDSFSEIAITLLSPYAAWVLAERLHGSAVLACVTGGLYIRQYFSAVVAPATRLQARAVWDLLIFVLNGIIFILIGLELGALRGVIPADEFGPLIWKGAVVSVVVIVVRLIWVPLAAYLPRRLSASLRTRDPMPPWSAIFLVGWTGLRGIVSLAAALALPLTTASGALFPFRAEIILITFSVIFSTLVLQGLSLKLIIKALRSKDDQTLEQEEVYAREHAAMAALGRLDGLSKESWSIPEHVDQLRVHYTQQAQRYSKDGSGETECTPEITEAFRQLRHETLNAERLALIRLRDTGVISDEILHRLEQELDVEALRLGVGERRVTPRSDANQYSGAEHTELKTP
jgi:CPA1 family monovalent cation:H+ antiporter